MGSKPNPSWGKLKSYLDNNGYILTHQGGDVIVRAPEGEGLQNGCAPVRIGHRFIKKKSKLTNAHWLKLNRALGITREQVADS